MSFDTEIGNGFRPKGRPTFTPDDIGRTSAPVLFPAKTASKAQRRRKNGGYPGAEGTHHHDNVAETRTLAC